LQIQRYRSKVSGPLLDRIDIQVEVPTLRYQELASKDPGEASIVIRKRVNAAGATQLARFAARGIHANAQIGARDLKRHHVMNADGEKLLETAVKKLGLSARAYSRVLKLSCTIADMAAQTKFDRPTSPRRSSTGAWMGECKWAVDQSSQNFRRRCW
jgi:magnesium chelatase family protein